MAPMVNPLKIRLLARVPVPALEQLRRCGGSQWDVVEAGPNGQLRELARSGRYDAIVLDTADPMLGAGTPHGLVCGFSDIWRCGTPVVLCLAPSDYRAVDRVAALAARHLHFGVIMAPTADGAAEIRARIQAAVFSRTSAQCVHELLAARGASLRRDWRSC